MCVDVTDVCIDVTDVCAAQHVQRATMPDTALNTSAAMLYGTHKTILRCCTLCFDSATGTIPVVHRAYANSSYYQVQAKANAVKVRQRHIAA